MNKKNYKIAIDGPAGSGKSTIAKLLAKKLGFLYIDSGAMYRVISLFMLENNLLDKSDKTLLPYIKKIKISLGKKILMNNNDVSKKIRTSTISSIVSEVSAKKVVREEMVKRQKRYGENNPVMMDGRDIGTMVFPDADLKIYLTASALVRAKRRMKDLKVIGENIPVNKLIEQIQYRDNYDSSRKISPLTKAQDAIVIDTSGLSVSQVLDVIFTLLPKYIYN